MARRSACSWSTPCARRRTFDRPGSPRNSTVHIQTVASLGSSSGRAIRIAISRVPRRVGRSSTLSAMMSLELGSARRAPNILGPSGIDAGQSDDLAVQRPGSERKRGPRLAATPGGTAARCHELSSRRIARSTGQTSPSERSILPPSRRGSGRGTSSGVARKRGIARSARSWTHAPDRRNLAPRQGAREIPGRAPEVPAISFRPSSSIPRPSQARARLQAGGGCGGQRAEARTLDHLGGGPRSQLAGRLERQAPAERDREA
jgi:hypothetical protein